MVRVGALVLEAVQAATAALLDADLRTGAKVVDDDRAIDELTDSIERSCYFLLARQQPLALDLRIIVSVLRVIHELERTGDLMVNVAKASRRLYPQHLDPRARGLIDRMREQATAQLRLALDAFAELDPARAAALEDMDDEMDDLQRALIRSVIAAPSGSTPSTASAASGASPPASTASGASPPASAVSAYEADVQRAIQVTLIARYFERTADHAVNIAERVNFIVTGELPHHTHPDGATG